MKKVLFSALPVLAIAAMAFLPINEPLPIGSPIPNADVKMKEIGGGNKSFNEAMKKNGLLVMFSCNTCPVVKKLQARINELCKYAMDNEVGVILLNPNEAYRDNGDSYDDSKSYAKANGFSWYYVMDDNHVMADAFGATRTPEVFLFDSKAKLAYHGAIDDNSGNAAEVTRRHAFVAIDELKGGKDISQKETKSVGCTIKRKKS